MSSKEGHGACMIYLFAISNRVEAICAHFSLGIHPSMEDNYFSTQDWKKLPPIYIYIYIYYALYVCVSEKTMIIV